MPPRHSPCENCRRHHVKCGNSSPRCARCEKFGRECIRINRRAKFRHGSGSTVRYIDETPKFTRTSTAPSPRSNRVSNDNPTPHAHSTLSQPTPPDTSLEATHTPWFQIGPSEASLLRYFVEELARWVLTYHLPLACTLCTLITMSISTSAIPLTTSQALSPKRARECLTLRHAILAASARHFSTLPTDRQTATFQKYNMKHDITIDEETVLYYHN